MINPDEIIEESQRRILAQRLTQCTPEQVKLFEELWPDTVPSFQLAVAIDFCVRMIDFNIDKEHPHGYIEPSQPGSSTGSSYKARPECTLERARRR